jgi:hypothetical protein
VSVVCGPMSVNPSQAREVSVVYCEMRSILDIYHLQQGNLFRRIKLGPVGQVRDKWLRLGELCLKTQIPSTKIFTLLNNSIDSVIMSIVALTSSSYSANPYKTI